MGANQPRGPGARIGAPGGPGRRPRSLRSHLLQIVTVAFLPLLCFCALTVGLFARVERSTFRRGAIDRTRALATAVDTELKRSVAALQVLAASDKLDEGDPRIFTERWAGPFEAEASRVMKIRKEWLNVHLTPPSGREIMNPLRPPGEPLPEITDTKSFNAAIGSREPVVGNVFEEPFKHRLVFPVRVPVEREGEVRLVLSALVDPQVIHDLLSTQELPEDWVGVVLNAEDVIVARTVDGERLLGTQASPSLRAALDQARREDRGSGWFLGQTLEGWPVYVPFSTSEFDWSVALGIPVAAVEGPLRRSLAYLGATGVVLLGSGIAVAWFLSRQTARSLEELSSQAENLGLGRNAAGLPRNHGLTGILEVDELMRAFDTAGDLIRTRSEERDRVESSLRLAEGELRESEQRKDHFLAMLGHELRNPLGVIGTAVHLMRELPPEASDEPRAMIERQVVHMSKLIDDLLDVSRIAEGRIQMTRELCDLAAIARETAEDHRAELERNGLALELSIPESPLWIKGDRTRLAQALDNLLQNAHKYTDPGGRIGLTVVEDPGGASASVTVSDTGVGMEPEILAHAFEPFSQADRTIARSRGGLGLGLPLVKGLVEAHGGTVRAESEGLGRGTRLVVQLPLEPALATVPGTGPSGPAQTAGRPRRILVVEDNEMAARSMQLYLEGLGHAVEVARTGSEGIAAAEHSSPEVVVCDIGLPDADGYEVARTLKRRADAPFMIAVSGYGQATDVRRAREAGFDGHLTKPIDLDEFRQILGELSETPRDGA